MKVIISKNRKRTGVSTILGTLIFVGILFSAIIPMQLVMKQADIMAEQLIDDNEDFDDDRSREEINVIVYPTGSTSNQIKVKVDNRAGIPVTLARLWIKDEYITLDEVLSIGESKTLGPYTVELNNDTSYPVKIVSERGNIFASVSSTLYFSDGVWFTPSLGINVYIANDKGKYHITVTNGGTYTEEYWTQGQDFNDLIVYFEIDDPDTYIVSAQKFNGVNWDHLPASPMTVVVQWPNGTPIVFAYFNGHDT